MDKIKRKYIILIMAFILLFGISGTLLGLFLEVIIMLLLILMFALLRYFLLKVLLLMEVI